MMMRIPSLIFISFFLMLFSAISVPVHGLKLDISHGHVAPIPIALTQPSVLDKKLQKVGKDIFSTIESNLQFSGLFKFIHQKAFVQDMEDLHTNGPRYGDWRILNIQALTRLAVEEEGDELKLTFYLYDVMSQKELEGIAIKGQRDQWRRMAHKISDSIYTRLTGDEGLFDTQIVYVHEAGSRLKRQRRLAVMDQDGANHRFLTDKPENIVLTPRYSPTSQRLVYLDYGDKNTAPRVQIMDMLTKKHQCLGEFPGMTFSPRFSPDGKKVVMSFAKDGNSAIYEMNLTSRKIMRLTQGEFLDMSPCYAPDAQKIVFNTNRSGDQQIYVMDADGQNMQRVSYGPGRYATPVWSPRGDWITFTKMYKGQFYIGLMRPDGTGERLLTTGDVVEDPSWSSNGRLILFTRTNPRLKGETRLYAIDLAGFNERAIRTPGEGSGATWSRAGSGR